MKQITDPGSSDCLQPIRLCVIAKNQDASLSDLNSVFVGIDDNDTERKDRDKRIITLLILAPLWTLIFTIIPVIVKVRGIGADIY
ncbi:8969_t:CDS:2, partial [Racocetra fulgida]